MLTRTNYVFPTLLHEITAFEWRDIPGDVVVDYMFNTRRQKKSRSTITGNDNQAASTDTKRSQRYWEFPARPTWRVEPVSCYNRISRDGTPGNLKRHTEVRSGEPVARPETRLGRWVEGLLKCYQSISKAWNGDG